MLILQGTPAPMKGFTSSLPKCEACKLYKKCRSPKMKVVGKGKKGILIVSDPPTANDDRRGKYMSGEIGRAVSGEFRRFGVDIRRDCWAIGALICKATGRATADQIACCRPNLIGTIQKLKPKVIILMGDSAIAALMPHIWRPTDVGGADVWAGYQIPCRPLNAWVCPTHPASSLLEAKPGRVQFAVSNQWCRHIEACLKLDGRPYSTDPVDERDEVEIIHDPDRAAKIIRKEMKKGGLTAFDYETTMLKPEGKHAQIVSCGICFRGERTVAYPWHGKAIDATVKYLRSPLPKAGANIKFEQRWTKAILKKNVRAWVWDSMQAAHILDCRRKVTSVKFQAFARMGTPVYDDGIKKYLVSDGPSVPNNIWKAPLEQLLTYNAVDALVEWRLAVIQSRLMGITLEGL